MITAEDLARIAEDICGTLFAGAAAPPADRGDGGPIRTLAAVVEIYGEWNGSVTVTCERATAVGIASVMFDMPGEELSGSDVIDALGEVANMAGGAVKGMIDGEKALGLPTVGEGIDFVMVVPNTTEVATCDYAVGTAGMVHLAVHEVSSVTV
jgi:chemotaxis protein CheX